MMCVPIEIWDDRSLTWLEKAILAESLCQDSPTPKNVAEALGIGEDEAQRAIASLRERGYGQQDSKRKQRKQRAKRQEPEADCDEVLRMWAQLCPAMPQPRCFTPKMKSQLRSLLKNNQCGVEMLYAAFKIAGTSPFLCGNNNTGWKASLQWVLSDSRGCFQRILDGSFGGTAPKEDPKPRESEYQ